MGYNHLSPTLHMWISRLGNYNINDKSIKLINHVGVCMSCTATLDLDEISKLHTTPLQQWITDGVQIEFWGDNVDKKKSGRDVQSDHYGSLLHMYSILAGCSRVDASELSHTGCVAQLSQLPADTFLPTSEDFAAVRSNLIVIAVGSSLTT